MTLDRPGGQEIAVRDIGDVQRRRTWLDRLLGTSTLAVWHRRGSPDPLLVRRVRRGAQLAAILELLASEPEGSMDPAAIRAALAWEPRDDGRRARRLLVGVAGVLVVVFGVVIGLRGEATRIGYPEHDAIYPNGRKQDRDTIVQFMEQVVMPWARTALAPIVGGADRVSCETCHGAEPDRRGWRMPSVAALPEPHVQALGWEMHGGHLDAQMRNAIYGYVAPSENQARAGYMRMAVMPGMARLLGRPAYDFTRTYEYNRTRFAFGCYHCHRVK